MLNYFSGKTINGSHFTAKVKGTEVNVYRNMPDGEQVFLVSWTAKDRAKAIQQARGEVDFLDKEVGGNDENF